jgi:L-asparaginase
VEISKLLGRLTQPHFVWPWVEILGSGALANAKGVEAWTAQGIQGLVVATTGNGTVHQALEAALLKAQAQGVVVWLSTRCVMGYLKKDLHPVFETVSLPPVQARVALMLYLGLCGKVASKEIQSS